MARDLKLLHPKVAEAFTKLQQIAHAKGIEIICTQTLRTDDEQKAYYAQGRQPIQVVNSLRAKAQLPAIKESENKWITNAPSVADSFHGYGIAFDIAIKDKNGKISWDIKSDFNGDGDPDWLQVGKLSSLIPGLEWGGNWSKSPDFPHYQMRCGLTIADLKSGKKPPL